METLYVISNPLFPNYVKVGFTKCLYSRLKKLSTSVPKSFKVEYQVELKNASKIERLFHGNFGQSGLMANSNESREWYPLGDNEFFGDMDHVIGEIKNLIRVTK